MAAQDSVLVQIARPYAQALFDLASSEGVLEPVERDLQAVAQLALDNAEFSRFLRSPVIGAEAKAKAMAEILAQGSPHPMVANFIGLVARNGRLFAFPVMVKSFRQLTAAARGEVTADVTSATPLSSDQLSALALALRQKIGKTVKLIEHVDASLIGGLVVKVGSQMIDSSLKTKLTAMKIAMKEVG